MLELQDQLCKLHLEHRGLQRLQCQSYQELGSKKHELYQVLEEPECGDMEEHIQGPGEQSNPDVNYPKPLPIEESPRRRALSLPIKQSQILRVSMEEEGSLLCCCKLKKKVQFADSLGLNLASVKHFLPSDEPLVPPSVLARLQSYPPTVSSPRAELAMDEEMYSFEWASNFPATPELREKVEEQGVCLEQVSDSHWGVRGSVLVRQPSDGVQVKVRYTFNDWLSFLDCPASPPEKRASFASVAGAQRFLFTLCYPPTTSQVHFAICCNMGHGQEVWDNNQGNNYTVNCQPELIPDFQPSDTEQEEWGATQHW
ncbi:protein phosphatase 1 regulatory subunit 3G [Rhinophrynus dorsalis]